MMRLLAIDTSTWWGGAALVETSAGGPRLVAEIGLGVDDSHAAHALAIVEALLSVAGWPKSSLDAYVAARGPGSFTGIRVAMGLARGLGLASGRPCLGVGTLDAMAEAFGPAPHDRVPLLDAGRGEVYGARFDPASTPPCALSEPWVAAPETALDGGASVVFGPGAERHATALRAAGYRDPIGRGATSVAAGAARIAARLRADAGDVDFTPLYVRPPDAKLPRP
ncbi:MAG TPA: tRNA (adenosine(37)-N6)-threonylcarbamoyltransferase complex dimerization subunit type 1 TsaB [Candidatus Polarisedimenticolaceae bacterium]|nr:tRNA (adenosine(37)-N6)-threonylcarbamoyltransferase complex dimerization subunit type 1 TsaB [Candidatus Polarisedimenticolaceae bacterium]